MSGPGASVYQAKEADYIVTPMPVQAYLSQCGECLSLFLDYRSLRKISSWQKIDSVSVVIVAPHRPVHRVMSFSSAPLHELLFPYATRQRKMILRFGDFCEMVRSAGNDKSVGDPMAQLWGRLCSLVKS